VAFLEKSRLFSPCGVLHFSLSQFNGLGVQCKRWRFVTAYHGILHCCGMSLFCAMQNGDEPQYLLLHWIRVSPNCGQPDYRYVTKLQDRYDMTVCHHLHWKPTPLNWAKPNSTYHSENIILYSLGMHMLLVCIIWLLVCSYEMMFNHDAYYAA
jgi:hypothetical protein